LKQAKSDSFKTYDERKVTEKHLKNNTTSKTPTIMMSSPLSCTLECKYSERPHLIKLLAFVAAIALAALCNDASVPTCVASRHVATRIRSVGGRLDNAPRTQQHALPTHLVATRIRSIGGRRGNARPRVLTRPNGITKPSRPIPFHHNRGYTGSPRAVSRQRHELRTADSLSLRVSAAATILTNPVAAWLPHDSLPLSLSLLSLFPLFELNPLFVFFFCFTVNVIGHMVILPAASEDLENKTNKNSGVTV
jgi:hypothetical protein